MALTATTDIIKPNFENIPNELKQRPQWVLWRAIERKGKITKTPFSIKGAFASVTNPNTWASFQDVEQAFQSGKYDGIGFVFTSSDEYIGLDLDGHYKDGKFITRVSNLLNNYSYTEVSPSGTGLHIIFKGTLPTGTSSKNTAENMEIYSDGRYFTFTGEIVGNDTILENQNIINNIVKKYFFQNKKPTATTRGAGQAHTVDDIGDSELLYIMFNSKQGQAIQRLFNGDTSDHNGDHSSADQALCNHLAFYTAKNAMRMDNLFRQSGLYRDKWDKKHSVNGQTYGEITIQKAISDTINTYSLSKKVKKFNEESKQSNDDDNLHGLEYDKKGERVLSNSRNAELILSSHPFKGVLAFDAFKNTEAIKGDLPWRKRERPNKPYEPWLGSDDKRLLHYFGKEYDFKAVNIIQNAYIEVTRQNAFHPVKEYLEAQKWDGKARVETFFIDYLGADDTPYIRAVTRKWLVAAITRIYEPGCKFDYMPVLVGPQGAGKSSTIAKLAREWFSDSLKNFESKEAGEQLQNSWIFEFGELAGMKKAEVEEIKAFITKQSDIYRVAYDRVVSEFPRKCVFIGTTNKYDFLRDQTGNRRFWPVVVDPDKRKYNSSMDLSDDVVGQIWAESMEYYKQGEKLYLDPTLEAAARKIQESHMEEDPRSGFIKEYLDMLLPEHWDSMEIWERRNYYLDKKRTGTVQREKVCAVEVWAECLGNDHRNMKTHEARAIADIIRKMDGWEERKPARTRFKHYGSQTTFIRID